MMPKSPATQRCKTVKSFVFMIIVIREQLHTLQWEGMGVQVLVTYAVNHVAGQRDTLGHATAIYVIN